MYDATFGHNIKEGIAICATGVYYRTSTDKRSGRISWNQLLGMPASAIDFDSSGLLLVDDLQFGAPWYGARSALVALRMIRSELRYARFASEIGISPKRRAPSQSEENVARAKAQPILEAFVQKWPESEIKKLEEEKATASRKNITILRDAPNLPEAVKAAREALYIPADERVYTALERVFLALAITQRGLYYKDNHMQHVRLVSWGAFAEFYETDCTYGGFNDLSFDHCHGFYDRIEAGKLMQELCDELRCLPKR